VRPFDSSNGRDLRPRRASALYGGSYRSRSSVASAIRRMPGTQAWGKSSHHRDRLQPRWPNAVRRGFSERTPSLESLRIRTLRTDTSPRSSWERACPCRPVFDRRHRVGYLDVGSTFSVVDPAELVAPKTNHL